jgi:insertion element IS1 protein InsB
MSPYRTITSPEEPKKLIDKLLLERIFLREIARVTGVSWSWLQDYVNNKLAAVHRQIKVSDKTKGKLVIECDEMLTLREAEGWSFVFSKIIKVYIWRLIDRKTREIIGCYLGDSSRQSAKKLWGQFTRCLPNAVAYTDFWESYKTVIPSKSHQTVGKETGQTNPIERLNK